MRILNICVNGVYTDYMSYHENLLPKYHKIIGHDVFVLASKFEFDENGQPVKSNKSNYIDNNGVNVHRLDIKNNHNISYNLKKFNNFYNEIENIKPDVIFCHLFQFLDALKVIKYVKRHPDVKLFCDCHADYSNSAINPISKYLLHGIIWKYVARRLLKYTIKFYGVLPNRVEFLKERYKLSSSKIELLPMGADDILVKENDDEKKILETRKRLNVSKNQFLISFGGKLDFSKTAVLSLMKAVAELDDSYRLVIFGSVDKEFKDKFNSLLVKDKVEYIGWLQSEESYPIFAASDLACFPGRHSVFWEQVVAQGIPLLVKKWPGITHIDFNGNVEYLHESSVEEIRNKIVDIKNNKYSKMKGFALKDEREQFLYSNLAKRSLCL